LVSPLPERLLSVGVVEDDDDRQRMAYPVVNMVFVRIKLDLPFIAREVGGARLNLQSEKAPTGCTVRAGHLSLEIDAIVSSTLIAGLPTHP
tara:strand:+ start:3786 stop:4058 length:273 start_codon:yes stop_codon:yes gene_type:complete